MYTTPFYWFVPNDDNRVEDGRELRIEWLRDARVRDIDPEWLVMDCSVLEMLIALSRRVAFASIGTAGDWFWKLVKNLGLKDYTDDIYEISIEEEVEEVLDRLVLRTYLVNGDGGLFPLQEFTNDQRKIEIWYQMAAYLHEGHYLDTWSLP